jgi:hypothetical protein
LDVLQITFSSKPAVGGMGGVLVPCGFPLWFAVVEGLEGPRTLRYQIVKTFGLG